MSLKSYRELSAWQIWIKLVIEVYRMTKEFPAEERYGLVSQLRRAAVSIPSNIAEGRKDVVAMASFCNTSIDRTRIINGS